MTGGKKGAFWKGREFSFPPVSLRANVVAAGTDAERAAYVKPSHVRIDRPKLVESSADKRPTDLMIRLKWTV